jgi:hypothetical protein
MSAGDPSIGAFLGALKEQGRSSPAGMHWQRFYEFLLAKRRQDQGKPPVPLILAASGESDASKHRRLGDQLHWAEANGCLNEALRCLTDMPAEDWNTCPLAQWNQDSYPSW